MGIPIIDGIAKSLDPEEREKRRLAEEAKVAERKRAYEEEQARLAAETARRVAQSAREKAEWEKKAAEHESEMRRQEAERRLQEEKELAEQEAELEAVRSERERKNIVAGATAQISLVSEVAKAADVTPEVAERAIQRHLLARIARSLHDGVPVTAEVNGAIASTVSGNVSADVSGALEATVDGSVSSSVSGSVDVSGYVSTN